MKEQASEQNEELDPNLFKDPSKIVVEHKRCIFICAEKFSKDNKYRTIKGKKAEEGIPFLLYTLTYYSNLLKPAYFS